MDTAVIDTPEASSKPLISFYPYQRRWLEDKSRFKIGCWSRQAGKSFVVGAEIVDDVINHEIAGTRTHWVILSRGERQSVEFMTKNIRPMLKAYYKLLSAEIDIIMAEHSYERTRADGITEQVTYKSAEVVLPGGSRITALPANPDTARGYSANVVLDEFALHESSRELWAAIYPTITRGYKIRIVSTPRGKTNKFYDLFTAKDDTWSKHKVTIWDAVAEGLDLDPHELKAGLKDDEKWAQEYELEWAEADGAALLWDDIIACEDERAGDPDGFTGKRTFAGNDIAGKGNDLWVLSVFEEVDGRLWNREDITRRKTTFAEQDRLMAEAVQRYRMSRMAMDETGIGAKPVEDAKGRHGASRVQGIVFTNAMKQDLVQNMQHMFQDERIAIPAGDAKLRADLHSVKKKVTQSGLVSYHAPTGGESHGDRFWAYALACWAAKGGTMEYGYHAVPTTSRSRRPEVDLPRPRVRTTSGIKSMSGTY